jgi:hypothetical protein
MLIIKHNDGANKNYFFIGQILINMKFIAVIKISFISTNFHVFQWNSRLFNVVLPQQQKCMDFKKI